MCLLYLPGPVLVVTTLGTQVSSNNRRALLLCSVAPRHTPLSPVSLALLAHHPAAN